MTATVSSILGASSMMLTLLFVTATLVYLTISQQNMVQSMQKNLFQICYKSLASSLDNTPPQAEDSGVDEEQHTVCMRCSLFPVTNFFSCRNFWQSYGHFSGPFFHPILSLASEPNKKLNGTGKPMCWEAAPPKKDI